MPGVTESTAMTATIFSSKAFNDLTKVLFTSINGREKREKRENTSAQSVNSKISDF